MESFSVQQTVHPERPEGNGALGTELKVPFRGTGKHITCGSLSFRKWFFTGMGNTIIIGKSHQDTEMHTHICRPCNVADKTCPLSPLNVWAPLSGARLCVWEPTGPRSVVLKVCRPGQRACITWKPVEMWTPDPLQTMQSEILGLKPRGLGFNKPLFKLGRHCHRGRHSKEVPKGNKSEQLKSKRSLLSHRGLAVNDQEQQTPSSTFKAIHNRASSDFSSTVSCYTRDVL